MNSKKQNFFAKFLVVLALSVILASLVFAEPKSLRYNKFYPSNTLSGYATAIPPNTSITGNAIEVQPSTSSSPTFVVKESGYVGIGIPGPLAPLHVKTSAGQLKVSEGGSNSVNLTVRNNAGDGYGSLSQDASDYWWQTSGNTKMTLDSQGRLGIGTNSPQSPLHVKTSSGQLKVDPSGASSINLTVRDNADTGFGWLGYSAAGHTWYAKSSQEELMTLGSDGNLFINTKVGVGTTTPGAKLHVAGSGDNIYFGNGNLQYPSATRTDSYGAIVGRGVSGDFRLALQDGTGRVNYFWNAYTNLTNDTTTNNVLTAVNRYVSAGEPASRLYQGSYGACDPAQGCPGSGGGSFVFFGAPAGNSGEVVNWVRMGELSSGDKVSFSPRGVDSDLYIQSDGNVGIGTTNAQHGKLVINDAAVPLVFRETGQDAAQGGLWRMPVDGGLLRFDVNTGDNTNPDPTKREFGQNYVNPLRIYKDSVRVGDWNNKNTQGVLVISGGSSEGGQVVLGPKNGGNTGGEAADTWSIDSDANGSMRVFYGTGDTAKHLLKLSPDGAVRIVPLAGAGAGKFLCINDDGSLYRSPTACQ